MYRMNLRLLLPFGFVLSLAACGDSGPEADADSSLDASGDTSEGDSSPTDTGVEDTLADTSRDTATGEDATVDTASDGGDTGSPGRTNIRDFVFGDRSGDCADYVTSSLAMVMDIQNERDFDGLVDIVVDGDACLLTSNAIPNHDFNEIGARFATDVGTLDTTWSIPRSPTFASEPITLELRSYDGVMLNGVVVDLLAAGCFGVGDGRIGCGDLETPYRYDPMNPAAGFNTDTHNAHTQPDGRYHYHGDPLALYGEPEAGASGVIGFAADGFPIYGPYFDDEGTIREARSGYTLRTDNGGERAGGPGGEYDGTFVDDYEFTDAGDLDECNGMMVESQYGYYLTRAYPWVLRCLRGTPDPSFNKRR